VLGFLLKNPVAALVVGGGLAIAIPRLVRFHFNKLIFPCSHQVLGFLLENPVAALVVGGGLAIAIPRLVRLGVRFVVVPAVLLLILYLAARNPTFVWGAVSGTASGDKLAAFPTL